MDDNKHDTTHETLTPFEDVWALMYPTMKMPGKPTGEKCSDPDCDCQGDGNVVEMVDFCVAAN